MHTIQDILLTFGSIIFIVALLPTIAGRDKPALSTSLITSSVLLIFIGVYISLGLYLAASVVFLNMICWIILAIQKMRAPKS